MTILAIAAGMVVGAAGMDMAITVGVYVPKLGGRPITIWEQTPEQAVKNAAVKTLLAKYRPDTCRDGADGPPYPCLAPDAVAVFTAIDRAKDMDAALAALNRARTITPAGS